MPFDNMYAALTFQSTHETMARSMSKADDQKKLCADHGCSFVPVADLDKIGVAESTLGKFPINGLRHPATNGTTGWYIWCGEAFSEAADFFTPLCVVHAVERLPDVDRFLGLPPGYRFLAHGDYVDVWFDPTLLNIQP